MYAASSSADPVAAQILDYKLRVERVLDGALPRADLIPQRLHAAQRYAVLGGGKRLRPLLVYCTGEALGIPKSHLDAPAAAVELIHVYSLVHDDLPAMDDGDIRHGLPTTHRAFDEATAILVGDALQVLAFALLAREQDPPVNANSRLRMMQILAAATGSTGMAGGQALDLASVSRQSTLAQLDATRRLKTGALISASVMMAAACAPSLSPAETESLIHYADAIGFAHQIQDELLDLQVGTPAPDRTIRSGAAKSKPTYPGLMGIQTAKIRAGELKTNACGHLRPLGEHTQLMAWLASYVVDRRF